MSKHEIRLRRQKLTGSGAERFRNYGAVLQRHKEEMRIKKIIKAFGLFLIILSLIALIVLATMVEKRQEKKQRTTAHLFVSNKTVIARMHPTGPTTWTYA